MSCALLEQKMVSSSGLSNGDAIFFEGPQIIENTKKMAPPETRRGH
jgi:hypothetical protein